MGSRTASRGRSNGRLAAAAALVAVDAPAGPAALCVALEPFGDDVVVADPLLQPIE